MFAWATIPPQTAARAGEEKEEERGRDAISRMAGIAYIC
jgi:hypothetical protein